MLAKSKRWERRCLGVTLAKKQALLGFVMDGSVAHTEGDAAIARNRKASASRMEQTPYAGAGAASEVTRENMKRPWASRLRVR